VRLVLDGKNLGVVSTDDAKSLARQKGLDLVEISPNSRPPVCQIIDYGKYAYERKKRQRQTAAKAQKVDWKEIRLTPGIGEHDIETKVRKLRQFLERGKHVKVTVRYKRRQIVHQDQGLQTLEAVVDSVKDIGKTDNKPRMEGKQLTVQIVPK
jgi:translation initiation factor IF-3